MGYGWYALDDAGNPVRQDDSDPYRSMLPRDRIDPALGLRCWRIGRTDAIGGTDAYVSTVFLGLDHSYGDDGPPVLWETMAFNVPTGSGELEDRYTSRADAIAGHAAMVAQVEQIVAEWKAAQQAVAEAQAAREARRDAIVPARPTDRTFDLED
jgi:hypothetical protein